MAIAGFTQDPNAAFGAGTFQGDDGSSVYAYHPDLASQFVPPTTQAPQIDIPPEMTAAAAPQEDMRVAGPGGGPPPANNWAASAPTAPLPPPPAAAPPAPPANRDLGDIDAPAAPPMTPEQQQQEGVRALMLAPKRGGAAHPAQFVPKSKEESYSEAGAPYDPEQADLRQKAAEGILDAHLATAGMLKQRADTEALGYAAAQPGLAAQKAKAQSAYDAAQAGYERDKAKIDELTEQTAQQKIDPNQWFTGGSLGAFGGIMAVIGQALGAKAATQGGTENFAQKIVQNAIDRDIASQRQAIEQGRAKRDNALQMLNVHYKDLDQATTALHLIQSNVAQNEMLRQAALYKRDDIMSQAKEDVANWAKSNVDREQTFYNQSIGKRSGKVEMAYQPASSGGGGLDLPELARRAEAMRKLGVPEDQIAKSLGLPSGEGGKENQANVQHLDEELRKEKIPQTYAALGELEGIVRQAGTESIPGIGTIKQHAPGWTLSDDGIRNRAALDSFVLGVAHATGRVSESEVATVRNSILGNGSRTAVLHGIEWARNQLHNVDRSVRASVPKQASDTYVNRGGVPEKNYEPPGAKDL